MNCPQCGHGKSSVRRTERVGGCIKRYRACTKCGHHFPSFEGYEPIGKDGEYGSTEMAFDVGEAVALLKRARPWLQSASHIPIVRDGTKLVVLATDVLSKIR